ncbi:MAG: NAD(P)/FAD-dependent oxidoreductase [Thermoplasmata archaeon]|nr:NAD(P)/FAD-dependent oxidoreductase [Thermoplasmata archaeon]
MIDVAVAGGGPAGSASAALLARDHDVAVFEEHSRIGEPVQCAGLLTGDAIKLSGVSPGILSTLYGAEVVFPDGNAVRVRSDSPKAHTVDRSEFDSLLADRAVAAGAEYRTSDRVRSFSAGGSVTVVSDSGEHTARLLVGADGHTSAVAAGMGLPRPEYLRGIQATVSVRMDEGDMFRMRLGSRYAPGFFTWEIPCGDVTRVGLCASWSAGPPAQYLKCLLSDLGWEDRVLSMQCGKIPMGPVGRMSGDRVMLIGDAASHVKPVSAGGIYPSMMSAPILADVAGDALDRDDLSARSLGEYDRRWRKEVGPVIERGAKVRRIYARMDDGDLSRAGRYASRDDVRSVLDGISLDDPAAVVRGIMRRPRAAAAGAWTLLRCLV